jgi:glycosyltransferase involved in cell wall biosynthesis
MASLNLLFVHEVSYEKKPIFEMHEFPEHLAARGHKVTFLQFDEGYKFWQGNRQPTKKTIPGRVLPETSISIVTPHQFGIPGVDRIYATASIWPALNRLLKNQKFDAIVLYAVPTYGFQVIRLAKKFGVPVIFRALDVSHLIRKSLFSPLIKASERYVYKHSDVVSANNPALANYSAALGNRREATVTNLPPLDLNNFKILRSNDDSAIQALRESLGVGQDDKVIVYLGSFFYFSGLDTVIREFAKVSLDKSNLKLLLIGGGEKDLALRRQVRSLGLDDQIIFTGFVPYADLRHYLALATVCINPMKVVKQANLALPQKVLQYVAADKPVVSTQLEGLKSVFGLAHAVQWVPAPHLVVSRAVEIVECETKAPLTGLDVFGGAVDDFLNTITLAIKAKGARSR